MPHFIFCLEASLVHRGQPYAERKDVLPSVEFCQKEAPEYERAAAAPREDGRPFLHIADFPNRSQGGGGFSGETAQSDQRFKERRS